MSCIEFNFAASTGKSARWSRCKTHTRLVYMPILAAKCESEKVKWKNDCKPNKHTVGWCLVSLAFDAYLSSPPAQQLANKCNYYYYNYSTLGWFRVASFLPELATVSVCVLCLFKINSQKFTQELVRDSTLACCTTTTDCSLAGNSAHTHCVIARLSSLNNAWAACNSIVDDRQCRPEGWRNQ